MHDSSRPTAVSKVQVKPNGSRRFLLWSIMHHACIACCLGLGRGGSSPNNQARTRDPITWIEFLAQM
jgi:hypothetical protein